MATKTIASDLRRNDDNRTLWNPYWLVSREIKYSDLTDTTVALLWSFPAEKYGTRKIIIENVAVQVVAAFTGGTPSLDLGSGTLATDIVTAGGLVTVVDDDEYVPTANITESTPGTYFAATGDWITAYLLKTNLAPVIITPADTTVPCIYMLGYASASAGACRVLLQVSEVPCF